MHTDIVSYTAEDKRLIRNAYRRLVRSFKVDLPEEDKKVIFKAFKIASDPHVSQRRKSGEPYILHPIEVARIVHVEIGLGPTAITCALLHDVVEDTKYTLEEVKESFGKRVGLIVDGLTKLDGSNTYESPHTPCQKN